MSQEKVIVIVEVNGGCVSNIVAGDFVDVQILDWDNIIGDVTTPEETREVWNRLAKHVKEFVQRDYPEDFDKVQGIIKNLTKPSKRRKNCCNRRKA